MSHQSPSPLRGAAAGLVAGFAASFAMNQFQKRWDRAAPMPDKSEPSTVKAAQKASRESTGEPLPEADKKAAGNLVHYLFGGGLGALYGVAAEYRPEVTAGFGLPFGLGASLLFDEVAVPAAGLSPPPGEVPAKSHLYGIVSHLVYGVATEGVRRAIRTGAAAQG